MCEMCYSELAVYCALKGWWGWVMRKPQTSLTYRGDKLRERYQMLKKIFWGKKMPVRLLYERVWGTTISPLDEVCYIVICLCETLNILKSHYKKKIFQDKKWTIS